jgi:hypothetical protein
MGMITIFYRKNFCKISQQPKNCENRNDPDLVQAFLKKWWVESNFKAPNLPLSLRLNGSGNLANFWKLYIFPEK